MSETGVASRHKRAWIMVKARSPQAVAKKIYEALGHEGEDDWVLVRADVVDDYDYDIVIPVTARTKDKLQDVEEMIQNYSAVTETRMVHVNTHVPVPPHNAHGYITLEELESSHEPVEAGRQGASPGYNPWG